MKSAKLALALVATALTLPLTATSASAYQCKRLSAVAKVHSPTKAQAVAAAQSAWTYKVKKNRGLAWSVWSIAKNKRIRCKPGGQRWVCTARAKPCLYVVS